MAIHHVLVIDDSKTELMFLTDLLQKNGMSVRTAEGAEEAIKTACSPFAERKPTLVFGEADSATNVAREILTFAARFTAA